MQNGPALTYAGESLKRDAALAALKSDPYKASLHVSEDIRHHPLCVAVRAGDLAGPIRCKKHWDDPNDPDAVMMAFVTKNGGRAIDSADDSFRRDRVSALAAVTGYGMALQDVSRRTATSPLRQSPMKVGRSRQLTRASSETRAVFGQLSRMTVALLSTPTRASKAKS